MLRAPPGLELEGTDDALLVHPPLVVVEADGGLPPVVRARALGPGAEPGPDAPPRHWHAREWARRPLRPIPVNHQCWQSRFVTLAQVAANKRMKLVSCVVGALGGLCLRCGRKAVRVASMPKSVTIVPNSVSG